VKRRSQRRSSSSTRDYPRTARLNHLLQEIIAEEIERIDDERLGLFTVVAVDVDADLNRATVHYSTLGGESILGESALGGEAEPAPAPAGADDDDPVVAALAEHRPRLQSAIARQATLKRTPEVVFRPDEVVDQALRIEQILHDINTSDEG
jgi:ribosome-binding factor A